MSAPGKGGRGERAFPRPLLDRFLLDENGHHPSATMDAREYVAAIRRDAETLLATRAPDWLPERDDDSPAASSVVNYGLPDFSHLSPDSPDDRWRLAAAIRETLERFETRLENIRVEVGEKGVFTVTADTRAGLGRMEFAIRPGSF